MVVQMWGLGRGQLLCFKIPIPTSYLEIQRVMSACSLLMSTVDMEGILSKGIRGREVNGMGCNM